MHIKQWTWSDWLAIVMATTLVATIFLAHRHGSVSAKSKNIDLGMTYEKVVAVMGKPTRSVKEDAYWIDEDGEFSVYFDGGIVHNMHYESNQTFFMAKIRKLSDLFLD